MEEQKEKTPLRKAVDYLISIGKLSMDKDLIGKFGIGSKSTISEYLNGKPGKEFLRKFEEEFGIKVSDFEDSSKKKTEPTFHEQLRDFKLNPRFELIPYHDVDIAAANGANMELHNDKGTVPEDYYYIPEFSGCRAFNCFSDSMEPVIMKGSKIFARKIDNWQDFIEYGQIYAVGMNDGRRFLKYIKKASKPDKFLLVSENKHYDDFEVPMHLVRSVWLIDGSMDKRTQSTFFILKYDNPNPEAERIMTFGKHKGKKYSEIPVSYWRWLYDGNSRGSMDVDKDIIEWIEGNVPDIKHQAEKRMKDVK